MHSNYRSTSPPPPARPRSPNSSYALATSRSHTGIGGASGLLNSPFLWDEPCSQSASGVRRSPTTPYRSTFSPPRVPLFEDLPPHLYSRYADSQDYLTRHSRNTFTQGRRPAATTASVASYLHPSSGYSSPKDWNSPSSYTPARSYTSASEDPSSPSAIFSRTPSPYSVSPNSTKSASPVRSYNTHIVHEPAARPSSPTFTPSRSTLEHRPVSPQPALFVRTPTPLSRREEIMASRGVDHSDPLDIGPDTQQLIEESENIARDLDHRLDQSDRFMQEVDEKMTQMDKRRQEGGHSPRPRSWIVIEDKENISLPSESSEKAKDDDGNLGRQDVKSRHDARGRRDVSIEVEEAPKMSVLEVEIRDEDDLVRALRKSAERMTKAPAENVARKQSETHAEARQRKGSSGHQQSAARYEDTVSSYELRKREEKKPHENVFKKYMPAIIGGVVVLLIIVLLMTSMKSPSKSRTVSKKAVKEAATDVRRETIKVSKAKGKVPEKAVKTHAMPVPKSKPKISEKAMNAAADQLSKATAKFAEKSVITQPKVEANKTMKAVKSDKASNTTIKSVPKSKAPDNATPKASKKAASPAANKTMKAVTAVPVPIAKQKFVLPEAAAHARPGAKPAKEKKSPKVPKECIEVVNQSVKSVSKSNRTAKATKSVNTTSKAAKKAAPEAVNATIKVTKKAVKK